MVLLDTNIVIYLLKKNEDVIRFLEGFSQVQFSISMITRFEVLMGSEQDEMNLLEAEGYLDDFQNLDLNKDIIHEAVVLQRSLKHKLKFKDLLIAATAKNYGFSLITADSDFQKVPQINVIQYPLS
jgi:predicted nucleic acid-binding protein